MYHHMDLLSNIYPDETRNVRANSTIPMFESINRNKNFKMISEIGIQRWIGERERESICHAPLKTNFSTSILIIVLYTILKDSRFSLSQLNENFQMSWHELHRNSYKKLEQYFPKKDIFMLSRLYLRVIHNPIWKISFILLTYNCHDSQSVNTSSRQILLLTTADNERWHGVWSWRFHCTPYKRHAIFLLEKH